MKNKIIRWMEMGVEIGCQDHGVGPCARVLKACQVPAPVDPPTPAPAITLSAAELQRQKGQRWAPVGADRSLSTPPCRQPSGLAPTHEKNSFAPSGEHADAAHGMEDEEGDTQSRSSSRQLHDCWTRPQTF